MYDLGIFSEKKVDVACFLTLILGLDTSTFSQVEGTSSVIPYSALKKRDTPFFIHDNRVSVVEEATILLTK